MEAYEERRAGGLIERLYRLIDRADRTRSRAGPMMEALGGIAIAMVILYGGHQVIVGARTPGAFFSFITALLLAYQPVFVEYYLEAFRTLIDDNVPYVELRAGFGELYDLDGRKWTFRDRAALMWELRNRVRTVHPEFDLKLIYSGYRKASEADVWTQLKQAVDLRSEPRQAARHRILRPRPQSARGEEPWVSGNRDERPVTDDACARIDAEHDRERQVARDPRRQALDPPSSTVVHGQDLRERISGASVGPNCREPYALAEAGGSPRRLDDAPDRPRCPRPTPARPRPRRSCSPRGARGA